MLGYLLGTGPYCGLRGSGPVLHNYASAEAQADETALHDDIELLRNELSTMALVNKVRVRTLVAKNVCTAQEFENLFHQIDSEDGVADGKSTVAKMRMCPKCGKRLPMHRSVCMYCGEDAGSEITF
jgi:ribosomal protein L32